MILKRFQINVKNGMKNKFQKLIFVNLRQSVFKRKIFLYKKKEKFSKLKKIEKGSKNKISKYVIKIRYEISFKDMSKRCYKISSKN